MRIKLVTVPLSRPVWSRSGSDGAVFKMAYHKWPSCRLTYVELARVWTTSGKPSLEQFFAVPGLSVRVFSALCGPVLGQT